MTNAKNLNTQINKILRFFFLYFQSFHRIQIEREKLNKGNYFLFVSQAIFILIMLIMDSNITKLNWPFLSLVCCVYTLKAWGIVVMNFVCMVYICILTWICIFVYWHGFVCAVI